MAGDTTTVARPYAEAAFALACETKTLDAWSSSLGLLASIVNDPQVWTQVSNPSVSRERLRDLILGVAGEDVPAQVAGLVRLLAANRRLAVLPEVARLFDERKTAQQGLRQILVRSAFPLSETEEKQLTSSLKAHFGSAVELTVEEDASLIGGVEIRADDVVIDGSIRGKLEQLSNELQS